MRNVAAQAAGVAPERRLRPCSCSADLCELGHTFGNTRQPEERRLGDMLVFPVTASVPRGQSLFGGPSIIMPPGSMLGPPRNTRRRLDETWRVVFALSATAIVAAGSFFAIRFIIGFNL